MLVILFPAERDVFESIKRRWKWNSDMRCAFTLSSHLFKKKNPGRGFGESKVSAFLTLFLQLVLLVVYYCFIIFCNPSFARQRHFDGKIFLYLFPEDRCGSSWFLKTQSITLDIVVHVVLGLTCKNDKVKISLKLSEISFNRQVTRLKCLYLKNLTN